MPASVTRKRLCILVKAYPQPSRQYGETVCCAAITDTGSLLRLYPVPFRHLDGEQQFSRFDWIEADVWKAEGDPRPESYKLEPDSVEVIKHADRSRPVERTALWAPLISPTFESLIETNKTHGTSLGIVRPDPGSIRFVATPAGRSEREHFELAQSMMKQMSLLERGAPRALEPPEFVFSYTFECQGKPHRMKIHDWEVAAAWRNYRRRYREDALEHMRIMWEERFAESYPYIVLGTMQKRPYQFIIIGILRSNVDPDAASAQRTWF